MNTDAAGEDLRTIRAITLDLDDTLWDIGSVIVRAEGLLHDWLHERFPRITQRHSVDSMRQVRIDVSQRYPDLGYDISELRRRALRWHADDAGYAQVDVEQGFEIYFTARNEVQLFPEIISALAELSARWPLLALTNGNADLQRVGIAEYFQGSVSAAEVRAAKPDPAMFRHAAASLGCVPGEILHVGDDPVTDVQGARAAGFPAVWMNRHGQAWPEPLSPPTWELRTLGALVQLMDAGGCPRTP